VLDRYESQYGYDELVAIVVNVLTEYQAFNARHDITLPDLDATLDQYRERYPQIGDVEMGGTIAVTRGDIEKYADLDFEAFAQCRHSIRDYSDEPVAHDLIESAVRVAQKSPSVCNRQAPRVHVFTDKTEVDRVLSYQNGHRGFGHTIPCVMVITADLQSYYKPGERFQAWIDGGLFTMSLIFGLHAKGLGSCCLNWNVTKEDDRLMRTAVGIPDNEVVITMLAVGHLPDTLIVAESPRRPIDEVLTYG
jgi:nitroreductase